MHCKRKKLEFGSFWSLLDLTRKKKKGSNSKCQVHYQHLTKLCHVRQMDCEHKPLCQHPTTWHSLGQLTLPCCQSPETSASTPPPARRAAAAESAQSHLAACQQGLLGSLFPMASPTLLPFWGNGVKEIKS